MHADLLIRNGKCLCVANDHVYDWIAVTDNNISGVGYREEYKLIFDSIDRSIDANGNTVLPGFYDSHFHLVQTGLNSLSLDLSKAASFDDIGDLIREQARLTPEQPIHAKGLYPYNLKEKCFPDRTVLDKFCNDVPVWVTSSEFHISALNTYGILYYKIPFTIGGIELDSKAMPTGIFKQQANVILRENILRSISNSYRLDAVKGVLDNAIKHGITTIDTMEGGFLFCNKDAELIYDYRDTFPIDVNLYYQTSDIKKVKELRLSRMGSNPFIDGTLGSRNAALYFPYADDPNNMGELYFTQEDLNEFLVECYKNRLQTSLHVIGGRAIELAIKAHEHALNITGNTGLRHRLEHVELVNNSQILRARELGLVFSMQPTYEHLWGGKGKMYEVRIGEHYKEANPFREILDSGVVICGSSESDVTPIGPTLGIHSAVNHSVKEHRVERMEAIRMFTINGAFAVFEEKTKGSLEVGKVADIVILNKDIMNVPQEKIKDVAVETTIKSGCILYHTNELCLGVNGHD
ncbi:amidohydrolase [Aminipila butyrica]|uniref:Amidohydrolase n=1 Tax=Aminipila butyrica TaxID=433296 RepID=A0A858BVJ6_9FIRM|nr:amidohydrolase [Aminipila butyrica]QIB68930.1 amidohydrolase [Aminipila butyrica]